MNFLPKDLVQNNFFNDNENKPTSCDSNNIFEENSKENLFEMKNQLKLLIIMMNLINIIQMKIWK